MTTMQLAPSGAFSPTPSVDGAAGITVDAAESPGGASVVGVPIAAEGDTTASLGFGRDVLAGLGFDASVGSTLTVTTAQTPGKVAVGTGGAAEVDASSLRTAAAAFARAAAHQSHLAFSIVEIDSLPPAEAAQAVVEGVLLARYRYDVLRSGNGSGNGSAATAIEVITVVASPSELAAAREGARRGRTFAAATAFARDLANTPHSHLDAARLGEIARGLGPGRGLEVEVFDKEQLVAMGCGGLLGVNQGSAAPPRMIQLRYRPSDVDPEHHLSLVGKGIMYDAGGIALKPGDEVHAQMKNDMSGAAAILAAMSNLAELGCRNAVDAYLMCTDNMPSGTALALGDVITIRGGTTVEVVNTDAEGRLVMSDALVLAAETGTDAVIDMATLTGACMRALGTEVAGVVGNDPALVDQVREAAATTDEPVWELPLERRYRKQLDSSVADLKNLGGPNAGAITAALFLAEFVGDVPWAHIDIAGTAQSGGDQGWQTAGCTGFGARLLLQLALDFTAPRPGRSTTAPLVGVPADADG